MQFYIAPPGSPILQATNKLTGQTAAVSSVASFTPGHDSIVQVGGGLLVTSYTSGTINLQVSYYDQSGTSQTATLILQNNSGTATAGAGASGAFYGNDLDLVAQAGHSVTVLTSGTFTATYNVSANIKQLA